MRVIFLICLIIMLCGITTFAAEGPFDVGSKKIGGSIYFMSQGGDAYRDHIRLSLSPQVMFFSSSGMYYGGAFNLEFISSSNYSGYPNNTYWAFGPIVGFYLNSPMNEIDISGRTFPFVELAATYGNDDDVNIFSFGGTIGMTWMASNAVGLDFGASFTIDNFSYSGNSVSGTTILVGIGVSSFVF